MSFLQPWMLFALPVIALPIIIHLINQWRYRTVRWGAMRFLLAATRMSRGYARIRQWLILAARTLAIGGLIFAVSRPLSSGWLSLAAGGRVDTTIVVLDRSPSMQQKGRGTPQSKLDAGLKQLQTTLGLLRSNRWILIDSVHNKPIEFDAVGALSELVEVEPVSASADMPALLQTAFEYIRDNRSGRSEVWILSDVRRNDWDADGSRWSAIRDSFLELPQTVRFHLLGYPDIDSGNRSIRVTEARRARTASGYELLLSLRIEQSSADEGTEKIPVQIEIAGGRSEFLVELTGTETDIRNHAVPLDGPSPRGWGRVSLPTDSNPTDDEFFFVFDQPPPRKSLIVTDDPEGIRPLVLAASIPAEDDVQTGVETLAADQLAGVDWEGIALVLWQAPLPTGTFARELEFFVRRGGMLLCFPPDEPDDATFAGIAWTGWQDLEQEAAVAGWTADQDLLANTRSGASLPVGNWKVYRRCGLKGESTPLATLNGGAPLLTRALLPADPGMSASTVYFCTTGVGAAESSLARDGVVLYVLIQRALAAGAAALGTARQFIAGDAPDMANDWERVAGTLGGLSTAYHVSAGVYEQGERLYAVNRGEPEDSPNVVPDAKVAELFQGLQFDRMDDQVGSGRSLLSEIWRLFLAMMMAALLVEAALCIPRRSAPPVRAATEALQAQGAAA